MILVCSQDFFLCDRNLVSFGVMYLLGGFEGMLIRGERWLMAKFEVYFDTIFPTENSRNLY